MEVAITKISPNGQVVIPVEIRRKAKIKPSTKFLVFNEGDSILLKVINKKSLVKDVKLMESILRGEEDVREGRVTKLDTDMSVEDMDEALMS
tara:strand:+ start:346 stop:621 length:276 start_codon:yes stop_codon:yes gene_type:complete